MKNLKLIETKKTEQNVIDKYASNHYQVQVESKLEHGYKVVRVRAIKSGEYLPVIFVDNDDADDNFEIAIQTTSHGALELEEIEKVIKGYEIAVSHLKEIKEILGVEV